MRHKKTRQDQGALRAIKKYPNRRLYDTSASCYITMAEIKQLVIRREAFVVRDARTGDDLTRCILLQIILEEEAGNSPMFATDFLASIIRFYGHEMQNRVCDCLGSSIQALQTCLVEPAQAAETAQAFLGRNAHAAQAGANEAQPERLLARIGVAGVQPLRVNA